MKYTNKKNLILLFATFLLSLITFLLAVESYAFIKREPIIIETFETIEIEKDDRLLKQQVSDLLNENANLQLTIEELQREIKLKSYSDAEIELLMRVAASEAGMVSAISQKNVVFVILNRVYSERFPDNIKDVVNAPGQFAVIASGAYLKVAITDELKLNIEEAILEFNYGESAMGALFFSKGRNKGREFLFKDEVGHIFEK